MLAQKWESCESKCFLTNESRAEMVVSVWPLTEGLGREIH